MTKTFLACKIPQEFQWDEQMAAPRCGGSQQHLTGSWRTDSASVTMIVWSSPHPGRGLAAKKLSGMGDILEGRKAVALSTVYLPIYRSSVAQPSVCLSVCLSVHLSVHVSSFPQSSRHLCLSCILSFFLLPTELSLYVSTHRASF